MAEDSEPSQVCHAQAELHDEQLYGGDAWNTVQAHNGISDSNSGPKNIDVVRLAPNSDRPPATDHGSVGALWHSLELTHRRVQNGGWTHQVTERELPLSKDIAGLNMRIVGGAFREAHWHLADKWAYMLTGEVRITWVISSSIHIWRRVLADPLELAARGCPLRSVWEFGEPYTSSISTLDGEASSFSTPFFYCDDIAFVLSITSPRSITSPPWKDGQECCSRGPYRRTSAWVGGRQCRHSGRDDRTEARRLSDLHSPDLSVPCLRRVQRLGAADDASSFRPAQGN